MSETQTIVLDVAGMKCAGCVSAVEKTTHSQAGVKSGAGKSADGGSRDRVSTQYHPQPRI